MEIILKFDLACNHSELLLKDVSSPVFTGVLIDGFPTQYRLDLKEIGIIAEFTESALSFDVIDTCFAYIANDISVMLELPFDVDYSPRAMFVEAMSMIIDISILPPGAYSDEIVHEDDERWDVYIDKVLEYTRLWLSHPMNDQNIHPISGFFGHMVAEHFGFQSEIMSNDVYMTTTFVKGMNLVVIDKLKDRIRGLVYDHFGGEKEFGLFANSMANAIAKKYS